jgi:acyl-CoA synthetase (AMP-forming)/AMP-acid ligase II
MGPDTATTPEEVGVTLRWTDGDALDGAGRAALIGPGAPFELAIEDVSGTPLPVFVRRPRTIVELLRSGAERFADQPYAVFPDRTFTFASVVPAAAAVAATLRDRYGVRKGDRVAIAAANVEGWLTTFWAAVSLGAVVAALNGWWTGPEMVHGIELTTPKVVLGDRRRLERLDGHTLAPPLVVFEDSLAELERAGQGASLPGVELDEDDPFLILFTSGTTGRPKGAVLSHRNQIHFMWASVLGGMAKAAVNGAAGLPTEPAEGPPCVVSASPMFHISGLNAQLVMAVVTAMKIVYPSPGRWTEAEFLTLSERHRATNWSLVPTQLWRLLQYPELDRYDLSSLRTMGGGSAVWSPGLLRLLEERLPALRPRLGIGFGMTETSGLGTGLRTPETYMYPESVGAPAPGVEAQVRAAGSDDPLPEGVVGEVCLRSAANFLGYWDQPDATTAALAPGNWYRTGDLGRIEGGLLYLEGRRSDLIIRGGENIYPIEIENRVLEHPDIDDVAIVGIDHPILGEEVKAFVVVRPGADVTPAMVQAWVGEALASFKVPTYVEVRAELPRNAAGKVMKHVLLQADTSGFVRER